MCHVKIEHELIYFLTFVVVLKRGRAVLYYKTPSASTVGASVLALDECNVQDTHRIDHNYLLETEKFLIQIEGP